MNPAPLVCFSAKIQVTPTSKFIVPAEIKQYYVLEKSPKKAHSSIYIYTHTTSHDGESVARPPNASNDGEGVARPPNASNGEEA